MFDVTDDIFPRIFERGEGLDDAVGESGGDEFDLVVEEKAEEKVAVGGLFVISTGNDFFWTASEGLCFFLFDSEFFTCVIMSRGCSYC